MTARVLTIQPIKQFCVYVIIIASINDLVNCFNLLAVSKLTIFFHSINQNLWEIFNKVWKDTAMKDSITSANSSHFLFCGIFLQLLNFCWIFLECFKDYKRFKHDLFCRVTGSYQKHHSSFSSVYGKFYF